MAKTTKQEPKFNLSRAIRSALEKYGKCTAAECIEMVKKANPGQSVNKKTASVTWSRLRGEMGVSTKQESTARAVPKSRGGKVRPTGGTNTILAAAELVKSAGSIAAAREALHDLERAIQVVKVAGVPF